MLSLREYIHVKLRKVTLSLECDFEIVPHDTVDLHAPLIMFASFVKLVCEISEIFTCCVLQIPQYACRILQYEQHWCENFIARMFY